MRDPEFLSLVVIVGLPIILAYLLMALRIFERRFNREESEKDWGSIGFNLINIRDAALVTLALDLSELLNTYTSASVGEISSSQPQDFLLLTILLLFHLTVLFTGMSYKKREISEVNYLRSRAFNRLFQLYLALIILMTNAVTIKGLMGAL